MPAGSPVVEWRVVRPAAPLRPYVHRYVGYRLDGFSPGRHLGLPSPFLTVVVGIDAPTHLTEMPDPGQAPGSFLTMASGLSTRRAVMTHDGHEHGVQMDLTPSGARALLGLPAGALGPAVIGLADLLGPAAVEVAERLAAAVGWPARFGVLDDVLTRRTDRLPPAAPELERAWGLVLGSGGRVAVSELAREVGWSRRHLTGRFTAEYGLGPKEAARVTRFARSRVALSRPVPAHSPSAHSALSHSALSHSALSHLGRPSLAEVAVASGFYDQAHLCREWAALAGCSPTAWLAGEEFPSVQDTTSGHGAG